MAHNKSLGFYNVPVDFGDSEETGCNIFIDTAALTKVSRFKYPVLYIAYR